jgi:hypothetical protein
VIPYSAMRTQPHAHSTGPHPLRLALVYSRSSSVVDPKVFVMDPAPSFLKVWIRILLDLQKVPVPDPTLNIHAYSIPIILRA